MTERTDRRREPDGPAEPRRPATSLRSWQAVTLPPATVTTGLTAGVFGDRAHTVVPGLGATGDGTFVGAFRSLYLRDDADLTAVRDAFHETRRVAWHIVRTIATSAAFGTLAWALDLHGRVTADAAGDPRRRRDQRGRG